MRVVILVGNYLPRCSAVGNCMRNIAECLVVDHEVTVVCFRQNDSQPSSEVIDAQRIVRVATYAMKLRYRSDARIAAGSAVAKMGRLFTQIARHVRLIVRKNALEEGLVRAYLAALEDLGFTPDLLVPTCMPYEAIEASVRYKITHPNVKLVPYLFDQFAASATLYAKESVRSKKEKANLALERKMLKHSDAVLNITWESHVARYHEDYQEKLRHVEHPLLVRPKTRSKHTSEAHNGSSVLVYAGAFAPGIRDPEYALRVISKAIETGSVLSRADFYVPNKSSAEHWFDGYLDDGDVMLLDAVPSERIPDIYGNASWLLSVGNRDARQKVSKIYEYMAYGKPIVHIASARGDDVSRELSSYPLALCLCEGDPVEESASRLVEFLSRTKGAELSFERVSKLFVDELPETVLSALLESVGGGLLFAGTLNKAVNLDYMLEIMKIVSSLRLDVHTSDTCGERLGAEGDADGAITILPWLSGIELENAYAKADCLLSVGEVNGRQLSSKIFGYMAAGKPIVHIYHGESDANLAYLRKYPLGLCVGAKSENAVQNAHRIALFVIWSKVRSVSYETAAKANPDCVPSFVCGRLLEAASLSDLPRRFA